MDEPEPAPEREGAPLRVNKPLIIGGAVAGVIVLLLVVAQIVLPGIAASKVAGDLEDIGPRPDVEVSAFPAVKLLLKKADKVEVEMDSATMGGSADIAEQLEQADDVDELDVRIDTLKAGPLTVRDARLTKDGDEMTGTATISEADLRRQVPDVFPFEIRPQETEKGLVLGSVEAPFIGAVPVLLTTVDGGITAAPDLAIADQLLRVPIFSDPRVSITSVGATKRGTELDLSVSGSLNP